MCRLRPKSRSTWHETWYRCRCVLPRDRPIGHTPGCELRSTCAHVVRVKSPTVRDVEGSVFVGCRRPLAAEPRRAAPLASPAQPGISPPDYSAFHSAKTYCYDRHLHVWSKGGRTISSGVLGLGSELGVWCTYAKQRSPLYSTSMSITTVSYQEQGNLGNSSSTSTRQFMITLSPLESCSINTRRSDDCFSASGIYTRAVSCKDLVRLPARVLVWIDLFASFRCTQGARQHAIHASYFFYKCGGRDSEKVVLLIVS